MACGLPVIITDFGDNANWVEENKNGFVIPARSPQALAEKIVYLCKHPLEREQIGMNNWLKISEEYNYYREMKKIAVVYSYLMNGGGK
jgi:glycosyltransferase involved in cell wall biosynthesis